MGISVFPAPVAGSKTKFVTTLTSGTDYTVPAGVTYLNVTLVGGGGGGGSANTSNGLAGSGGQIIMSNFATTPGASVAYAIGAGGTGGVSGSNSPGGIGGTTTMTGATSATGGPGGTTGRNIAGVSNQPAGRQAANGGQPATSANDRAGGDGGAGCIYIEYWV